VSVVLKPASYLNIDARGQRVLSFSFMSESPPHVEAEPVAVPPAASLSQRETLDGPPPERTPHADAMLERWGLIGRLLSRLFFHKVFFPVQAAEVIRRAAAQGTVVYVLRLRNTIEFLYFNYAFLAHGLPLARFANGVRLWLWQPLGHLLRRIFGKPPRRHDTQAVLRRLTRARRSTALFLRNRPGLVPPVEFEGPYLQTLIDLQREIDRPIQLVPLTVIWGRRPVRPSQGVVRPLLDPLLGDQDEPRLSSRIWQVLRHAHRSLAVVCEPLDLQQFLAGRPADDSEAASALDQLLLDRIEAERRVRIGPRRAHPIEIRRRILEMPNVREAIATRAANVGLPVTRVRRSAARQLRRMHASLTPRGLSRLSWIVRQVWKRIFRGFEIDEAGMARVQQTGKQGPLLFLPTHRSHVDYLVMSDLCIARDVVPPHIAAGINLSFWPVGWLFRTAGAFFLRRRYQGDELYATLLREYVSAILREGHNIEVFIEGGRTRTGQVLPPKLGLLSVIADLVARGEVPSVHVVPASIGYERVVELASLTRELTGGAKQPESVGSVLRAASVLRSRYGWVNVQLAEPFEVRAFLAARGYGGAETPPEVRRRAIRALGFHSNAAASAVTAVTPTALCAAALLAPGTRGVRRATLLATIDLIGAATRAGGARYSVSMWRGGDHPLTEEGVDAALELLGRDKAVSVLGKKKDLVYAAEDQARIRLEYYKNQMVQHVLTEALMAMALRALQVSEGELIGREAIDRAAHFLTSLVRLHFVHHAGESIDALSTRALERLTRLGLVRIEEERVSIAAGRQGDLALLAGLVESTIEAQGAVARAVLVLRGGPMARRPLESEILEQLHRWYLTGEVRRFESCQSTVVKAAVDWLCEEGILVQQGEEANITLRLAKAHTDGKALEILVDRTERLLPSRRASG
jgi:glycerol-3-phosphate O-acyltransferase